MNLCARGTSVICGWLVGINPLSRFAITDSSAVGNIYGLVREMSGAYNYRYNKGCEVQPGAERDEDGVQEA